MLLVPMASSSDRLILDLAEVLPRDSSIAVISAPGGDVVALDEDLEVADVFCDGDVISPPSVICGHDLGTFPPLGETLAALMRA